MSLPPNAQQQSPFGAPTDIDFEADLTNVAAGGGLPVGDYLVALTDIAPAQSSKNDPMWVWEFTVIQGPHEGRSMKMWTVKTDKAMWKIGETVSALGLGEVGAPLRFKRSQALGRKAIMHVIASKYNGKDTTSIGSISPLPEASSAPNVPQGAPVNNLPH